MVMRSDAELDSLATMRRRVIKMILACGAGPAVAIAQTKGRVRLIVPTSSGSATDTTARILQPGLSSALGVPVVVEPMPGASGIVGLHALARSDPNDMTLAVITNSLVTLPSVMKSFPFDVTKDFTPIAMLTSIPMVMAVNAANVRATNAKELIALLKSKPDSLTFGSSGLGSISHLVTEMFLDQAGVKARHIPYQGPGPMTMALVGGQIDFATQGLPVFLSHITKGSLRPIGVSSASRLATASGLATFVEQGMPNMVAEAWTTLIGPKGMDPARVKRLQAAASTALSNVGAKEAVAKQGGVVALGGPADAQETIRKDLTKYTTLAKKIGLDSSQ